MRPGEDHRLDGGRGRSSAATRAMLRQRETVAERARDGDADPRARRADAEVARGGDAHPAAGAGARRSPRRSAPESLERRDHIVDVRFVRDALVGAARNARNSAMSVPDTNAPSPAPVNTTTRTRVVDGEVAPRAPAVAPTSRTSSRYALAGGRRSPTRCRARRGVRRRITPPLVSIGEPRSRSTSAASRAQQGTGGVEAAAACARSASGSRAGGPARAWRAARR